jgi:hypothetical protein
VELKNDIPIRFVSQSFTWITIQHPEGIAPSLVSVEVELAVSCYRKSVLRDYLGINRNQQLPYDGTGELM